MGPTLKQHVFTNEFHTPRGGPFWVQFPKGQPLKNHSSNRPSLTSIATPLLNKFFKVQKQISTNTIKEIVFFVFQEYLVANTIKIQLKTL
jgi:hypothetical protein